ncbi:response regulator transcription factor [Ruminococcaceae bacterium OttesenSCG-928-I18]|nr:response regulator transcription factor [Ruminococcaceae bacterium OttesenSCG-928-I18]
MKTTVLVIEDDNAIRNLITAALESFGYAFRYASNGKTAIMEALNKQPDLFILDLGLPDMDGTEIIKRLRDWTNNPIIVVSARSEIEDKIKALDAGADDYLTKPFSMEELFARIRVAVRKMNYDKSNEKEEPIFENGGLCINYLEKQVWVDDVLVHLTPLEYKLLCMLAQNAGKVLTHNQILKGVWGNYLEGDTQSLRVFMSTLRRKIEKNPTEPIYLQTHIGVGYRLIRIPKEENEGE